MVQRFAESCFLLFKKVQCHAGLKYIRGLYASVMNYCTCKLMYIGVREPPKLKYGSYQKCIGDIFFSNGIDYMLYM